MSKFHDVKTLQKFVSAHASIHNYFNSTATSATARVASLLSPKKNGDPKRIAAA